MIQIRTLLTLCFLVAGLQAAGCTGLRNSWPMPTLGDLPSTEDMPQWRTDVEVALDEAKLERRPTLIYWGAVWCPPCSLIKSQILDHPQFQFDTQDWAKIYVDGDSHNAQHWGEQFNVVNYPTVILLNQRGDEIQRFHEVVTYAEFQKRLAMASSGGPNFDSLVSKALNGEATEQEWAAIVNGARDHYQTQDLYDEALISKLLPIYKRCPRLETIECDTLALAMISASLEAPLHSEIALAALQDVRWLGLWQGLSTKPQAALHFANHFQYVPGSLVSRLALFEDQEKIAQVLPGLVATYGKLFKDSSLSVMERHNAGLAFYQLSKALFPDKGFNDAWFQAWYTLLDQSTDKSDLRLIFPTVAKMLMKANRHAEVTPLIDTRFQNDPTAWYQIFGLARSTVKLGDYDLATKLLKESWSRSHGRSTVLQVISRSAALIAEFPSSLRCKNIKEVHARWKEVAKRYGNELKNRDAIAQTTMEQALKSSECEN